MEGILTAILDFIQGPVGAAGLVIGLIGLFFAYVGIWVDIRRDRRERGKDRRERENLSVEQRRLAEVNVRVRHEIDVTTARADLADPTGPEHAFVVFRLPLQNLGDGPVDILGALVAARVLTAETPGAGLRGRDLGWKDFKQLPWNYPQAGAALCGISTTKHLNVSDTQFPRIAVGEDMELLRIDGVNDVQALHQAQSVSLMYRLFLVARGYTLGEILRQLGGDPPDPLRTAPANRVQFQSLAQPNFYRWFYVQKAMFVINRFVFRLATDDADPLGNFSTPDAWRLFLLHHWDFIDDDDVAPPVLKATPAYHFVPDNTKPTCGEVVEHVKKKWYEQQLLPDNWQTNDGQRRTYQEARNYCRDNLKHLLDRWEHLMSLVREANEPRLQQERAKQQASIKFPDGVPNEWYPRLIHSDVEHQARWLALMNEGYLITAPLASNGTAGSSFVAADIPPDPRVLEPYVMRTHYFLTDVRLPS